MLMDIISFAQRYLFPYKLRGNEIVALHCPFCRGGHKHDKESFSLNMDSKVYNCMRGKCGVTGTYNQLLEHFNEKDESRKYVSKTYERKKPAAKFKKPTTQILPLSEKTLQYIALRKISKETCELNRVGEDEKGNIIFPIYDESDKLCLLKFRPAKKVQKGQMKSWREEGGKAVLFGMHACNPTQPLVITEGEFDKLALNECGVDNVVSVPSGSEDLSWVDLCWEWLGAFNTIIIFGDNDEAGHKMVEEIKKKIPTWKLRIVDNTTDCKDANEILVRYGPEKIFEMLSQVEEIPVEGIVEVADIEPLNILKTLRIRSNISALDADVGGFMAGDLNVLSGSSGSGKTTVLNTLILESLNQNCGVCAYSGELAQKTFRYWIDLQAAGNIGVKMEFDDIRCKDIPVLTQDVYNRLSDWYRGRFFIYDSFLHGEAEKVLNVFEYAARRHNTKFFVIDNLMTIDLDERIRDLNRAETAFIKNLKDFAVYFGVVVNLVAHVRKKTTNNKDVQQDDVQGSSSITKIADNVLAISKVEASDRAKDPTLIDTNAIIDILKNRFWGTTRNQVKLKYNPATRRLYSPIDGNPNKMYGWCTGA